jgi:hypothetical protein
MVNKETNGIENHNQDDVAAKEKRMGKEIDELLDEELEEVTGGLFNIRICVQCGTKIALSQRELCSLCFLLQKAESSTKE